MELPIEPLVVETHEPMIDEELQKEVSLLTEDLNRQKKTEDDISFERITESWNHHSLLPKLFMLVVVLCVAWLTSSGDSNKFSMVGVECVDYTPNSTCHDLCITTESDNCLKKERRIHARGHKTEG